MAKRTASAAFLTQGRLLQELGERLVARADVALTELIKNSYDADASQCEVKFEKTRLIISDTGHGMSEHDFLTKWMEIATPDKQVNRVSKIYKRNVTGSKGIGRFAARFLGQRLQVETVAVGKSKKRERLTATFNWPQIDKQTELRKARVPYTVEEVSKDTPTGTVLTISKLRSAAKDTITKNLRTDLLSIAYPYAGLEKRKFARASKAKTDPGFSIELPSDDLESETNLSEIILDNAFARLTIDSRKTVTNYYIFDSDGKELLHRSIPIRSTVSNGFFADIRYFPERSGMFRDKGVDGRSAWKWIRDNKNNGIGIVDHGFRIRPYGFGENDWLQLSYDAGKRSRNWRSPFTNSAVKMPKDASTDAKANPMLYLPGFHQLIGAVFVESAVPNRDDSEDLTPSMDREGFVSNAGFVQLRDLVRTGLEMLAFVDHREQRKAKAKERRAKTKELRKDLKSAVEYIQSVPGLAKKDRDSVVKRFEQLSTELDDTQQYYRVGLHKLEMMGLLGVMAGFVTHEMNRVLFDLEQLLERTKKLERKDSKIKGLRQSMEVSLKTVADQLEYSTTFVGAVHDSNQDPGEYFSRGVAKMIASRFKAFTDKRGVSVKVEIEGKVKAPRIPKALYHGIAMNLFTNSIKAAIGGESASKEPKIIVKAWNENGRHVFEVADNGIGIPPSMEKRIWDPLFTTTSASDYNPLGSGMGLGLTLVERLIKEVKGTVALVDAPPGFSTCFRVVYPLKKK
jgi:signal transduction histidine kinase